MIDGIASELPGHLYRMEWKGITNAQEAFYKCLQIAQGLGVLHSEHLGRVQQTEFAQLGRKGPYILLIEIHTGVHVGHIARLICEMHDNAHTDIRLDPNRKGNYVESHKKKHVHSPTYRY